jgi:heptosyltransferase-3
VTRPRILVIRGGAIGDFILTLPALRLLRENFPEAELEILGYKHIIALAEGRYYADATRSIEYAGLSGFFNPRAELDPDLVAYFTGFNQIISYLYDPDQFFAANLARAGVKNFLHAYRPIDDSAPAARQLALPLERLALYVENHEAQLFPNAEDHAAAEAAIGSTDFSNLIAIHPGSGSPQKNWPIENWIHLAKKLLTRGARLLVIGGEADETQLRKLEQSLPEKSITVVRNLPLPHLAAALKNCARFIGHDSGISHIAAATGTRCVLLFGPTDPAVWAPAGSHTTVLTSPDKTMASIDPATVEQAIGDL